MSDPAVDNLILHVDPYFCCYGNNSLSYHAYRINLSCISLGILISAHPTFLVVEQSVVSHEHPVVVQGGGGATGVEHAGVVPQQGLEGLQVARIRLSGVCAGASQLRMLRARTHCADSP